MVSSLVRFVRVRGRIIPMKGIKTIAKPIASNAKNKIIKRISQHGNNTTVSKTDALNDFINRNK